MSSAVQPNETERLKALASYQALDTQPEFQQDALTELAAEICRCPVALVSLVDERRQWFKSNYGLPAHFTECPARSRSATPRSAPTTCFTSPT